MRIILPVTSFVKSLKTWCSVVKPYISLIHSEWGHVSIMYFSDCTSPHSHSCSLMGRCPRLHLFQQLVFVARALTQKCVKDILWRLSIMCRSVCTLCYILRVNSFVCSTSWCVGLGNGIVNILYQFGHMWDTSLPAVVFKVIAVLMAKDRGLSIKSCL